MTSATNNLSAVLSKAGMTQAELARRVGVGESHVSRWVRGMVPVGLRRRQIAQVLGAKEEEIWP